MKFDRMRAPALAAVAVLLISGAGMAMARSGPARPGSATTTPVSLETPVAADTDTLQQGDQLAPDASKAPDSSDAETTDQPGAASAEPTDAPEVPNASEPPQANSDGAGGHADPTGQNVDHQFNGGE